MRPALSAFLMMIVFVTTSTGVSFLYQPVSEMLGVGMGRISFCHSLMVASGAVAAPVVGRYIHKIGVSRLILITALWGMGCMFLYSIANRLWHFYAIAMLLGVMSSTPINLIVNVVLQTYYSTAEAASLTGIVMAGSGVGSIFYSNLIPKLLEQGGPGTTYFAFGVIWVAVLLVAWLILGKLQPANYEKTATAGGDGMTRAEALKSPMLYLLIGTGVLMSVGNSVVQHYPAILAEQGHSLESAGRVLSFYSVIMTGGKIAQGFLYGKAGIKKGSVVTYGLFVAGFVMLLNPKLSYAAFFCLGIGIGVLTTLTPILTKALFGGREYASIYGIATMYMSVGPFFATPAWGTVYDTFGSYRPAIAAVPVLIVAAFLLQSIALRLREKMN